jgi:hypothetical protein
MQNPCRRVIAWLVTAIPAATIAASASATPQSPDDADEDARVSASARPGEGPVADVTHAAAEPDELGLNNPASIVAEMRRDARSGEAILEVPAIDAVFDPWFDFKAGLEEQYGLSFGVSFTHLYQWASDSVGREDDASGFELVVDGTWNVLGRGTSSPTLAGFEFLWRDRLGTEIPPVALFTQISSLYPTTVAFGEVSPSVGQLWVQQKFENRWGFQVGKLFPVAAYDFFPLRNFRLDFVDGIHGANVIIPLPDRGLGGFVVYRPDPDVYVRLGVHDANADAESSGFNSLFDEGELFSIPEIGFDPGLVDREPERPPFGDVRCAAWTRFAPSKGHGSRSPVRPAPCPE